MATILLIEDDRALRLATAAALRQSGHTVETLPDGRRALERCRTRRFDIVVTALLMPEQEGLETIRCLRRAGIGVGIVALCDQGRHANGPCYLQMARLFGADATFAKPLAPHQLNSAVDSLLREREP